MTELDRDIQAVEHRIKLCKMGLNTWEQPLLEKRLGQLKVERDEAFKVWQSTVKPYRPPPPRFEILAEWEPDYSFVPMLIDEDWKQCNNRVNRGR